MSIRSRLSKREWRRQLNIAYGNFSIAKFCDSKVKFDVYSIAVKKADEIVGLFLKLMPLVPVLGGIALLAYLHLINRPELFIASIASLHGLVALFIGGLLVLVVFVLIFMAPWGISSYVLKTRGKLGSWKGSMWRVMATFLAVPGLILIFDLLQVPEPLGAYAIISVVLLFSLLAIFPIDDENCANAREQELGFISRLFVQIKWVAQLSGGMWIAALLSIFPIVVLVKLVDGGIFQAALVMGYAFFSALLGLGLSKVKGWKVWFVFGGAVFLIVVFYMNAPVLSGAARFLGIRHDDARWYAILDTNKVVPVLPESIPRSNDGGYIFAVSPFSFGENVVVCNSDKVKNGTGECVTLNRSEVRLSGKIPQKSK